MGSVSIEEAGPGLAQKFPPGLFAQFPRCDNPITARKTARHTEQAAAVGAGYEASQSQAFLAFIFGQSRDGGTAGTIQRCQQSAFSGDTDFALVVV
jgi:hypothetical protein